MACFELICGVSAYYTSLNFYMWMSKNYDMASTNTHYGIRRLSSGLLLRSIYERTFHFIILSILSICTYLSTYLSSMLKTHFSLTLFHFHFYFCVISMLSSLRMKLNLFAAFVFQWAQVNYIRFSNMVWSVF